MLNRLFGSFVPASGGQWPTLLDQQTKRGQWLQLKWARFFSLLMESPVLNRVWPAELRSTQISGVRARWGQGSAAFDAACGKQPERCPHNLPTALSSTVPLNLTVTDHQPRDDRMKKAVWVGKGKKAKMKVDRRDRQRCERYKPSKK